jgi:hypothetical protein
MGIEEVQNQDLKKGESKVKNKEAAEAEVKSEIEGQLLHQREGIQGSQIIITTNIEEIEKEASLNQSQVPSVNKNLCQNNRVSIKTETIKTIKKRILKIKMFLLLFNKARVEVIQE